MNQSKDTFDEHSTRGCPSCPHQQNSHIRNGDVFECWANDRCGCTVPVGQPTVATLVEQMDERFGRALQVNGNLAERIHILTTGLENDTLVPVGYFRAALYVNTAPLTEKDIAHCQEVIARIEARKNA